MQTAKGVDSISHDDTQYIKYAKYYLKRIFIKSSLEGIWQFWRTILNLASKPLKLLQEFGKWKKWNNMTVLLKNNLKSVNLSLSIPVSKKK